MSMLEPEYEQHYTAWKNNPSPENSASLLKALNPVISSAVKSYGGKQPSPTLASRAKVLALQGVGRYDPERAKLRTHLLSHLRGLQRFAAKESNAISLPERVALSLGHLHRAEAELEDRLMRSPSEAELADHMGLSIKRLQKIRQARPVYYEGQLRNQSEDGGMQTSAPGVVDANAKPWNEFVYHDLDPTDQVIMEHVLGMHGKPILPSNKIAAKLRLSPSAVSQRAQRIQQKLDLRDSLGVL